MKKTTNYLASLLLLILMFLSNFLNTNIFDLLSNSFAVWFVLSLLCFACGWYIDKILGWHWGGKVAFALTIAGTILSVILITMFKDIFGAKGMMTENLILYSLRNITLGSIAFFGMSLAELMMMQKDYLAMKQKIDLFETRFHDSNKEAELIIKEAKIDASKIIAEANLELKEVTLKKERIEKELKDFIQTEKELLNKYEKM